MSKDDPHDFAHDFYVDARPRLMYLFRSCFENGQVQETFVTCSASCARKASPPRQGEGD